MLAFYNHVLDYFSLLAIRMSSLASFLLEKAVDHITLIGPYLFTGLTVIVVILILMRWRGIKEKPDGIVEPIKRTLSKNISNPVIGNPVMEEEKEHEAAARIVNRDKEITIVINNYPAQNGGHVAKPGNKGTQGDPHNLERRIYDMETELFVLRAQQQEAGLRSISERCGGANIRAISGWQSGDGQRVASTRRRGNVYQHPGYTM